MEERRERLNRLLTDARHDAAELAFSLGHYVEAARLVEAILERDPLRP